MNDVKQIISEYVIKFSEATKLRKNKNYDKAIDKYSDCLRIIESLNDIDKNCETFYFLGQCYFYIKDLNNSNKYLTKCNQIIEKIDKNKESFFYYRKKGKLLAKMIHIQFAFNSFNECYEFINQTYTKLSSFNLNEKLIIFKSFLSELLYPLKDNKNLTNFLGEYISVKNEIMFGNEEHVNSKLKGYFSNLMNIETKQILFGKNNILFYINKYHISKNSSLANYIEKILSNDFITNDASSSIQKARNMIDNYCKLNKIKFDKEFNGFNSSEVLQERKIRFEEFNKTYFLLLSSSFNTIFKDDFASTGTCEKNNKINIKNVPANTGNKSKIVSSSALDKKKCQDQNNVEQRKNKTDEDLIKLNQNNDDSIKFNRSNKRNGTTRTSKNINVPKDLSINQISNLNLNPYNDVTEAPSLTCLPSKTKSDNYLKIHTNPCFSSVQKQSPHEKNNNKNNLFKKFPQVDEAPINNISHKNEIDQSHLKNISQFSNYHPKLKRIFNTFLFQTIVDEIERQRPIRNCDLVNLKIPNYVTSSFSYSIKGNHVCYGETSENENQDSCFIYENFLLLQNLYFFGVCDGHGLNGEKISDYAKKYLPIYIQYIEIDNNVNKHKKTINNLITSLYSLNEKSTVKEKNIIKYFYEKFNLVFADFELLKPQNFTEISDIFKESLYLMQNQLQNKTKEFYFDTENSGTTVCSLFLNGKNLYVINVGDSRAILGSIENSCIAKSQWKSFQLSKDHKPNDKEEKQRIIEHGGKIQKCYDEESDKFTGPDRVWFENELLGPGLAMSRSLGDVLSKAIGVSFEPDIYHYVLKKNDKFVVVASDGVWEYISNEECANIVGEVFYNKGKAGDAAIKLCDLARGRWISNNQKSIDDITCVVLFFNIGE